MKKRPRRGKKIELGGGESNLEGQVLVRTKQKKSEWSGLKKSDQGDSLERATTELDFLERIRT